MLWPFFFSESIESASTLVIPYREFSRNGRLEDEYLRTLLKLQSLDVKIYRCAEREVDIPRQKGKFDIRRKRLQSELEEREQRCKDLAVEQGSCESDIEQKLALIAKYEGQLTAIKKNEEYQALIHEIDLQKKQIGIAEERIIALMVELDDAKARLEEDRKRIKAELADIDAECLEIDKELDEAVAHRSELEAQREPLAVTVDNRLFQRYQRILSAGNIRPVVVPLNGEVCGGCHMHERAQKVNEVLAGNKVIACQHCGRLLYSPGNFDDISVPVVED